MGFLASQISLFPIGWDATGVTPNVLDHLLFAPLQTVAFPLADNIWWLSQLWFSLVCAHIYGHTLSENPYSGWMAGATLILCDSLIREMNWGHAPQTMWWAPLCTLICLEKMDTNEGTKMVHRKWDHTRYIRMVLPLLYAVYRTDLSSNMGEENTPCDCVGIHWNHHGFWQPLLAVLSYSRNDEYSDASSHQRTNPHHDTFGHLSSFWTGKPGDISNQISMIWMIVVCIGGYRLWRG